MEFNEVVKEDNSEVHENEQKMNKSRQDYRDTMTLIKMKMNKADTLIRQYNDKMKECDQLNEELSSVKVEKQDALSKYNITMEKLTKLELTNRKNEQSIVKHKEMADKQKIKLDENAVHISQLLARIKEIEEKNSSLEDDLKAQKQETKSVKVKVVEKKPTVETKQQASQTNIVEKRDFVTNTDPVRFESFKKKGLNKGINTEECRGKYTEPFPFFCKTCEKLIEPAPVDQILKIMSHKPPLLSPPESPSKIIKQHVKIPETTKTCKMLVQSNADQNPLPFENNDFTSSQEIENDTNTINNEPSNSSFMEKDKLERRVKKLEEMMKKLENKGVRSLANSKKCCAKNVKFVVQIPNQKRPCEYRKHKKRKLKRLNHKSKRNIRNQSSEENGWQVESCEESKKRKRISQITKEVAKKKKLSNQEKIELFDAPEVVLIDEELKTCSTTSSLQGKSSSPPQQNRVLNRPTTIENIPLLATRDRTDIDTVGHPMPQKRISLKYKNEDVSDKTCPQPSMSLHKSRSIFRSRSRSSFDTEDPSTEKSKPRRSRSRSLQSDLYLSSRSVSRSPTRESLSKRSTSIEPRSVSKDSSLPSKSPIRKSRSRSPGVNDLKPVAKNTNSSESCLDLPIKTLENERFSKDGSKPNLVSPTRTLRSQKLNRYKSESGTELQTKISSSLRLTRSKSESVTQVLDDSNSSFTLPAESIVVSNEYNCLTKQMQYSSSGIDILIPQVINDTSITKLDDVLNEEFLPDDSQTKTNQLDLEESQEDAVKAESVDILAENLSSIPKSMTQEEAPLAHQNVQFSMQNSRSDSSLSSYRKSSVSLKEHENSPLEHNARNLTLDKIVVENDESLISSSENDTSNFSQEQGLIISNEELISKQTKSIFLLSDRTTDKVLLSKNVENVENTDPVNKLLALEVEHDEKKNDSVNLNPTKTEVSFDNHGLAESTCIDVDESFKSANLHKTELGDLSSSIYSFNNILEEGEEIDDTLMKSDNKQSVDGAMQVEEGKTVKFVSIAEAEIEETRQLRSHNAVSNKKKKISKAKRTKKENQLLIGVINETNSSLRNTTVVSSLNDFISNPGDSHKIQRSKVQKSVLQKNETFVHELIYTIMEAEEWTTELHSQVVEQLLESQDLKTIAHFIIEHIADKLFEDEDFDKTHTPPAPIMTRSEQKLITLITSINKIHPNFYDIMIHGLQYKLFRLSASPLKELVVERLFRLLLVLNKLQKDREKVRILICDAMYCLNVRAVNIIYVALICWPEVLPKYNSDNNDIVVDTIIHIIMNIKLNKPYPKLNSLRKLLFTYYQYPTTGYKNDDFKIKLLTRLRNNEPNVDIAVLLMCKKMGPSWCLDNIIKQFKSMIGSNIYPSFYEPLTLLGNLLRSFPPTNINATIKEIIDELCDILSSKGGASDLQEGSASCLLSICKFNFEKIARSVINWEYNEDLRPATRDKLNAFFKHHTIPWWRKFVQSNFPFSDKVN